MRDTSSMRHPEGATARRVVRCGCAANPSAAIRGFSTQDDLVDYLGAEVLAGLDPSRTTP
jgi:hypothetical protein